MQIIVISNVLYIFSLSQVESGQLRPDQRVWPSFKSAMQKAKVFSLHPAVCIHTHSCTYMLMKPFEPKEGNCIPHPVLILEQYVQYCNVEYTYCIFGLGLATSGGRIKMIPISRILVQQCRKTAPLTTVTDTVTGFHVVDNKRSRSSLTLLRFRASMIL